MLNITNELKAKLLAAKSAEEVAELLKADGQEITPEDAAKLWEEIERTSRELTKEHLSEVTGGAGMKGDKDGKDADMARCPHCGVANTVPAKDGATVTCWNCGKDFQI